MNRGDEPAVEQGRLPRKAQNSVIILVSMEETTPSHRLVFNRSFTQVDPLVKIIYLRVYYILLWYHLGDERKKNELLFFGSIAINFRLAVCRIR